MILSVLGSFFGLAAEAVVERLLRSTLLTAYRLFRAFCSDPAAPYFMTPLSHFTAAFAMVESPLAKSDGSKNTRSSGSMP